MKGWNRLLGCFWWKGNNIFAQCSLGICSLGDEYCPCSGFFSIAATLLTGGRTAHSVFKLPLNLASSDGVTCNISKGTGQAHVLKQCNLIVRDEATMSHRNAFHAIDKTLQDLRGRKEVVGGATVVLSRDFRQTLPIIARGTPADEIKACLKNSYL